MTLASPDPRREKLRERLDSAHAELAALLDAVLEDQARQATSNPGWAVRDVVAHLAAAELGHQQVIRQLLASQPTALPSFDLDAYNASEVAARQGQSLAALRAEFEANRQETLALLESISPADWDRAGYHPGGFDTTVEGTFRVIAIHEKRHAREIQAALAAQSGPRQGKHG